MGTNLGDVSQEYTDAQKKAEEQGKKSDVSSLDKSVDSGRNISLLGLQSISPSSFFELKKEFLLLSESYIARFTTKLNMKKDAYENDQNERKVRELFSSKKLGESIGYEQYLYYSSILKSTNLIYRERVASAVFEAKDTLELFYFQVHFAYSFLKKSSKSTEGDEQGEEGEDKKKHSRTERLAKLVEKMRGTEEYRQLSDTDKQTLDTIISKQIIFGFRVYNAEAFTNGLRSILSLYLRTENELFLDFHNKIKQSFWIMKSDFVDLLGENPAFLIWIHIMLDANKALMEKEMTALNTDSSVPHRKTAFSAFNKKDKEVTEDWKSKMDEERMFKKIEFFGNCGDVLYKKNEFLYESASTEGIYFNDMRKYFRYSSEHEEFTINDLIIQLSKHTLYFYLYPIFLYSIAKKVQLSQNDFRILKDSGILMSSNVEDFIIVSNFYRDLNTLINKEENLGLTRMSFKSFFFHIKQWGIPLLSAGIISTVFALFFRFPLYFALIGVLYTILYIMSEFLLSYKLKIARVLTGYALLGLFFLLGGFNMNYQQVATERLTQAHLFLQTGSGDFDVEKAMVEMNTVINPDSMKTNIAEKSGSGSVKK